MRRMISFEFETMEGFAVDGLGVLEDKVKVERFQELESGRKNK